jgi:CRISPR type III-A-associated RAMP protein Csm4
MESARLKAVYLEFRGPFHLSDAKPNDFSNSSARLHSDTLYAALISALSSVGYPLEEYPELPFTLSSAFPYVKISDKQYLHFFPRPYLELKANTEATEAPKDTTLAKKIKKIQWLEKPLLLALLQGKGLSEIENAGDHIFKQYLTSVGKETFQEILKDAFSLSASRNINIKDEELDLIIRSVTPRIRVPRDKEIEKDTNIFYQERLQFAPGTGFFFLALLENAEAEKILDGALHLLGSSGIGSDRTVGQGQFSHTIKDFSFQYNALPPSAQPDMLMNLSLYCPSSESELSALLGAQSKTSGASPLPTPSNIGYEIVKRGGWVTSLDFLTYRKKSIYMFAEGSVFCFPQKQLSPDNQNCYALGANVDLTPEKTPRPLSHKIIRCGKALFLPVYLNTLN